ncbi:MAG: ABC transporter permease [Candidatus Aminicenantes bacterium]|nr:ABC transporter permease [Candidatus Aminicenantes bacterium]MDH5742711.1 ABC transporter permease [Candidatus Aminicenantes bacterium]
MFKNYMKITLRNIRRHKGYSFINVAGLVLGFTIVLLITIYIRYEFSYDRFHENADSIYRVIQKAEEARSGSPWWNATPGLLKSTLLEECPEVENAARLCLWKSIINLRGLFSSGKVNDFESDIYLVDPEFLEIFSFPLVAGDPKTALNDPFSILITRETAEKYFGSEDPVGKVLNADKTYDYKITGVLENVPANSHVHFDFLISFSTIYSFPEGKEGWVNTWGSNNYITYLQLTKDADPQKVQARMSDIIKSHKERYANRFFLDPVTRIHLHSNINLDLEANSDIRIIYLMSAIAFFILLIACFNYMNLSTARSALRCKEVGIRKVVGASRQHLIHQFIGESLFLALIALGASLLLVRLFLSAFSRFMDRDFHLSLFFKDPVIIILILGITMIVGLAAGSYPALFLSGFRPADVLKRVIQSDSRKPYRIRNFLVVFQFTISISLIICTFIIYSQLNYIKKKDLGFRKDHIVAVRMQDQRLRQNYEPLLEAFKQHSKILDVTVSDDLPYAIVGGGGCEWEGKEPDVTYPSFYNAFVGYNFLDFYGIELADGRNFSKLHLTDEKAYIVNETAVKAMGMENPVGKRFKDWKGEGTIIGVAKDFHFASLKQEVKPVVLSLIYKGDEDYLNKYATVNYFSLRIGSEDVAGSLKRIEAIYKKFTDYPFIFTFLDERIDRMYRSEQKLGQSFITFSMIAIFIACLGLFGLASFTAEQKTKEIGIRRILGASIPGVVVLQIRGFFKWLILSSLIACPAAYIIMNRWMQDFAYRADIRIWFFAAATLIAAMIALFTVSFQSVKAAVANPVDSLRYE